MRAKLLYSAIFLGIAACSSDKNKLCDCIDAGEHVNTLSESFFHRPYSELGKDSLDQAVQKRDELCSEFIQMSADELQALKMECDQLKIRVD